MKHWKKPTGYLNGLAEKNSTISLHQPTLSFAPSNSTAYFPL
jgi:hypothetical protein